MSVYVLKDSDFTVKFSSRDCKSWGCDTNPSVLGKQLRVVDFFFSISRSAHGEVSVQYVSELHFHFYLDIFFVIRGTNQVNSGFAGDLL